MQQTSVSAMRKALPKRTSKRLIRTGINRSTDQPLGRCVQAMMKGRVVDSLLLGEPMFQGSLTAPPGRLSRHPLRLIQDHEDIVTKDEFWRIDEAVHVVLIMPSTSPDVSVPVYNANQ